MNNIPNPAEVAKARKARQTKDAWRRQRDAERKEQARREQRLAERSVRVIRYTSQTEVK